MHILYGVARRMVLKKFKTNGKALQHKASVSLFCSW